MKPTSQPYLAAFLVAGLLPLLPSLFAAAPPTLPSLPSRPVRTAPTNAVRTTIPLATNQGLPSALALPAAAVPPSVPAPAPATTGASTPAPTPALPAALPGATNALTGTNALANAAADELIAAGVIKFQAAELNSVLEVYADLVQRTIIRPSSLPATPITIKTQTPLTRSEVIRALEAVLAMNGITLLNVGEKFVKVVPQAQAFTEAQSPTESTNVAALPELSPFVTVVRQITNARPSEVITALQPFAKVQGGLVAIDSSQILVIRDYADNVKRMIEMLDKVDVSVPMEVEPVVIPIKYALASDIAQVLGSLTSGGGVTTSGSSGASRGLSGGSSFGSRTPGTTGTMGTMPGQPGYNPNNPSSSSTMNRGVNPGTAQTDFSKRLQSIVQKAAGAGDFTILGATKIIADERTNSLLLFADKRDLEMITKIISKLDVVLAQVLIESIIMEVSLSTQRDLGVSYLQSPQSKGKFTGSGAVMNGPTPLPLQAGTNLASAFNSGFSYYAGFGGDFDLAVKAADNDGRINVIARPRIQTSHAVEASIFVGNTVPYITGTYDYYGSVGGSRSQYQQTQIGINLSVLPLINPDGLVVMDIRQRIQELGTPTKIDNNDVPTTIDREANAKISVRNRDTILLGGYIRNSRSDTRSGVPYLKDIPLLGLAFRGTTKKSDKTEMLVLMRPTVLPNPADAAIMAHVEKDRMPGVKRAEMDTEKELIDEQVAIDREQGKHKQLKTKTGYQAPENPDFLSHPATTNAPVEVRPF